MPTPQSSLFPYTTLFRSHEDSVYDLSLSSDGGFLASAGGDKMVRLWELISQKQVGQIEAHSDGVLGVALNTRSEEHTSELQSPCNLVCRLLLEKKKESVT